MITYNTSSGRALMTESILMTHLSVKAMALAASSAVQVSDVSNPKRLNRTTQPAMAITG